MSDKNKKRCKGKIARTGIILVILLTVFLWLNIEEISKNVLDLIYEPTVIYTEKAGIPLIESYQRGNSHMPIVVLQHGFKNNKKSMEKLALDLAKEGFFVIAPDAYAHGERTESRRPLVEIIEKTSQDYEKILEAYRGDSRVDMARLGMAGFSMGGCICFHYSANGNLKPKAIAPTISTPYFQQFIGTKLGRSSFSAKEGLFVEEDPKEIEKINEKTKKISPYAQYIKYKDMAILMQNGADDTYVTSQGAEMLMADLKDENMNISLIYIPDTKHKVTAEMRENIIEFMIQNL